MHRYAKKFLRRLGFRENVRSRGCDNESKVRMTKKTEWATLGLTGALAAWAVPAQAGLWDVLNLPEGVTPLAKEAYDLGLRRVDVYVKGYGTRDDGQAFNDDVKLERRALKRGAEKGRGGKESFYPSL